MFQQKITYLDKDLFQKIQIKLRRIPFLHDHHGLVLSDYELQVHKYYSTLPIVSTCNELKHQIKFSSYYESIGEFFKIFTTYTYIV